jgi:hypothetical protein
VPVPENENWLFINLVRAKLIQYESLVNGTLNLWDVIKLAQVLNYDNVLGEVRSDYQMKEIEKQQQKIKHRRR